MDYWLNEHSARLLAEPQVLLVSENTRDAALIKWCRSGSLLVYFFNPNTNRKLKIWIES